MVLVVLDIVAEAAEILQFSHVLVLGFHTVDRLVAEFEVAHLCSLLEDILRLDIREYHHKAVMYFLEIHNRHQVLVEAMALVVVLLAFASKELAQVQHVHQKNLVEDHIDEHIEVDHACQMARNPSFDPYDPFHVPVLASYPSPALGALDVRVRGQYLALAPFPVRAHDSRDLSHVLAYTPDPEYLFHAPFARVLVPGLS